jgi:nitrite reductase/ring-hydroxylating ferredoxin subunit
LSSRVEREAVAIGNVDSFPDGRITLVQLGDRSIGVYRKGDEWYALQNLCPHALGPICKGNVGGTILPTTPEGEFEAGLEGYVLTCPWHRWEFDVRTGYALFGIDRRRVLTFPVTVEDEQVLVGIRRRE